MLEKNYIPKLPFPGFKWKWASLQCTESLNDPVILLGVLFRMRKLENMGLKYSSPEFAHEMQELSNDVKDSIEELIKIVIPLSSNPNVTIDDYANFILWHRAKEIVLVGWPDCCSGANDERIAREYLLFLSNYGYLLKQEGGNRLDEHYHYNDLLDSEIAGILEQSTSGQSLIQAAAQIKENDIAAEIEKKRVESNTKNRPNQARFRKEVLSACERCIITKKNTNGLWRYNTASYCSARFYEQGILKMAVG
jgi:hypothetical protein